jgi:hypothetical protein
MKLCVFADKEQKIKYFLAKDIRKIIYRDNCPQNNKFPGLGLEKVENHCSR